MSKHTFPYWSRNPLSCTYFPIKLCIFASLSGRMCFRSPLSLSIRDVCLSRRACVISLPLFCSVASNVHLESSWFLPQPVHPSLQKFGLLISISSWYVTLVWSWPIWHASAVFCDIVQFPWQKSRKRFTRKEKGKMKMPKYGSEATHRIEPNSIWSGAKRDLRRRGWSRPRGPRYWWTKSYADPPAKRIS